MEQQKNLLKVQNVSQQQWDLFVNSKSKDFEIIGIIFLDYLVGKIKK